MTSGIASVDWLLQGLVHPDNTFIDLTSVEDGPFNGFSQNQVMGIRESDVLKRVKWPYIAPTGKFVLLFVEYHSILGHLVEQKDSSTAVPDTCATRCVAAWQGGVMQVIATLVEAVVEQWKERKSNDANDPEDSDEGGTYEDQAELHPWEVSLIWQQVERKAVNLFLQVTVSHVVSHVFLTAVQNFGTG